MQKSKVFSSDLKDENEDECLKEKRREFQITDPIYRKVLFPRVCFGHILRTRKIRVSEAQRGERKGE